MGRKHKADSWLSIPYHGNYVGPYWSAGKRQGSVAYSSVAPVDEFDRTAQQHDRAYALKGNLKAADKKFYEQNWGKGFKRSVAATLVGTQGNLRSSSANKKAYTMSRRAIRQRMAPPTPRRTPKRKRADSNEMEDVNFSFPRKESQTDMPRSRKRAVAQKRLRRAVLKRTSSKKRYGKKGKSKKRVMKRRRVMKRKLPRNANISITETAGNLQGPQAIYLGHGVPKYQLVLQVVKELWKTLFEKAGYQIINWQDSPKNNNQSIFQIRYADNFTDKDPGYEPTVVVTGTGAAGSHQDIAEEMLQQLVLSMPVTANAQLNFMEAEYFQRDPATLGTNFRITLSMIDLKSFFVGIDFSSTLKMQNVTPAFAGEGQTYEATNITSNPLEVTAYENKRQTTGLYPVWRSASEDTPEDGFLADRYTGEIKTTALDLGVANNSSTGKALFIKPPPPTAFDYAKGGKKSKFAPGAFKVSKVNWKAKWSFHTMMRKFTSSVFKLTGSSNTPMPFGNLKLYGAEHYLRQVDDVNVSINWQIDLKMITYSYTRKLKTQPEYNVFDLDT